MPTGTSRGVLAMAVAVASFAFLDAALKVIADSYPPLQVSAIRGFASLPFIVIPLLFAGRQRELRPASPGLHLLRGALGVLMMVTFVYALREQSLAEVYAIYMIAPLLVVALAAWLLKERVDLGRWLAVLTGLLGVLWILQPSAGRLQLVAGLATLISALAWALTAVMARHLTRTDPPASISFSFLLLIGVIAGLLAWPDWIAIRAQDWLWIIAIGGLGALAQIAIIDAFRHAPASTVAPIEYTGLLWGIGIDRIFWGFVPGANVIIGASFVIGAGLYVAWRERLTTR